MKTKCCFCIRIKLNGEIGAEVKNGYVERVGERFYGYDKRLGYWYITDCNTGLLINKFPKLKDCQEYLKENASKIDMFCQNRKDDSDDDRFSRAVAVLQYEKETNQCSQSYFFILCAYYGYMKNNSYFTGTAV